MKVPPSHAGVWWSIKEAVCVAEMQILKRLGFNMQVRPCFSRSSVSHIRGLIVGVGGAGGSAV